jgi:hypothetical protein
MQPFYLVVTCLFLFNTCVCATPSVHLIPTLQLISRTLRTLEAQTYDTLMVEEFHRYLLRIYEELRLAEREINNEQLQLEQEYRKHYDSVQHQFADVLKKTESQTSINNKLTADLVFYRMESLAAMRNEAKAVKRAEEMQQQMKRAKKMESSHGIRDLVKCKLDKLSHWRPFSD